MYHKDIRGAAIDGLELPCERCRAVRVTNHL